MISPLALINTALNSVLQYDLIAQKTLREMEHRSLLWEVKGWGLTMVFKVVNGELVLDDRVQTCQASILASPQELFEVWQNDDNAEINFQMKGNPLVLQDFSRLFKSINIDWQAMFEPYFGAVNTHIAGRVINTACSEAGRVLHRFRDDLNAYQRDERN